MRGIRKKTRLEKNWKILVGVWVHLGGGLKISRVSLTPPHQYEDYSIRKNETLKIRLFFGENLMSLRTHFHMCSLWDLFRGGLILFRGPGLYLAYTPPPPCKTVSKKIGLKIGLNFRINFDYSAVRS